MSKDDAKTKWCEQARLILSLAREERAAPEKTLTKQLLAQHEELSGKLAAIEAIAKLVPTLIDAAVLEEVKHDLTIAKSQINVANLLLAAESLVAVGDKLNAFSTLVTERKAEAKRSVEKASVDAKNLREDLQAKMAALMPKGGAAPSPKILEELRALAEQEFSRDAAQAFLLKAAESLQLGLPPPPAKTAFGPDSSAGAEAWSKPACEAAFKLYTWFDFKAFRRSRASEIRGLPTAPVGQPIISDAVMWKLYQYRRHEIDKLIAGFQRQFPKEGLKFKSGGSEDIESDLDITVASPNSAVDVEVMRAFNEAIKAKFGRPPGRVFDTNLYARDYNAIEDNLTATADKPANAPKDNDIAEPTGEMKKLANIDQDVATLMKQRRFMDADSFTKMWKTLQASIHSQNPDEEAKEKDRIRQQFEEAEAVYLLTSNDKVEKIAAKIDATLRDFDMARATAQHGPDKAKELKQQLDEYAQRGTELAKARSANDYAAAQRLMPEFLDFMEQNFEDEVMDATDDMYAERMAELRDAQLIVQAREESLAEFKERASEAVTPPDKAHLAKVKALEDELNAARARIKQAQFTNIVFANEAYVSQGAIKHIVAGKQAGDPAVLAKIEPAELLQSTNEQMADFLKDMKHMEHAEHAAGVDAQKKRQASGEAFVHASKYLARMLEAVVMLQDKYKDQADLLAQLTTKPYQLLSDAGVSTPAALQKLVESKLLRLRKSATIPGDVKAEMAVAEVNELFRTQTIAQLRSKIQDFCVDFNQRVRQLDAFRASQTLADGSKRETERQYFGATPA